jgi:hypothetical protein
MANPETGDKCGVFFIEVGVRHKKMRKEEGEGEEDV